MSLLKIEDLHLGLRTGAGVVHALQGVNLHVETGEVLALVGESGGGKTVTMQTVLGLFPPQDIAYRHGRVLLEGRDLLALSEAELRRVRGGAVAMVFQDPMTALNPTLTIGTQIAEAIQAHRQVSRAEARRLAVRLLAQVEVPQPEMRAGQFPFQLSGGVRQRGGIATPLARHPQLPPAPQGRLRPMAPADVARRRRPPGGLLAAAPVCLRGRTDNEAQVVCRAEGGKGWTSSSSSKPAAASRASSPPPFPATSSR